MRVAVGIVLGKAFVRGPSTVNVMPGSVDVKRKLIRSNTHNRPIPVMKLLDSLVKLALPWIPSIRQSCGCR